MGDEGATYRAGGRTGRSGTGTGEREEGGRESGAGGRGAPGWAEGGRRGPSAGGEERGRERAGAGGREAAAGGGRRGCGCCSCCGGLGGSGRGRRRAGRFQPRPDPEADPTAPLRRAGQSVAARAVIECAGAARGFRGIERRQRAAGRAARAAAPCRSSAARPPRGGAGRRGTMEAAKRRQISGGAGAGAVGSAERGLDIRGKFLTRKVGEHWDRLPGEEVAEEGQRELGWLSVQRRRGS